MVFANMLVSGDVAAVAIAWTFRQEHGAIPERFRDYVAQWPVKRVAREWEAFRAETRDMLGALADRIQSEEDVLYAHAARVMERRAA